MKPRIGIALGDVTGIGPEVTLKALAMELGSDDATYVIIGDAEILQRLNQQLGLEVPLVVGANSEANHAVSILESEVSLPTNLRPGATEAAKAAVTWLKAGARLCLNGELDALVTAPVNKESIVRFGAGARRPNGVSLGTGEREAHGHDAARRG